MQHHLFIKDLGPIKECSLDVSPFTVLTGPQSQGKSTIAKAIYFARTLKQDVLDMMAKGGSAKYSIGKDNTCEDAMRRKSRDKFLSIFGSSWSMPLSMELRYTFNENVYINVILSPDYDNPGRNFVAIVFSDRLVEYFDDLDQQSFIDLNETVRKSKRKNLEKLLNDPYSTIFIPAGRNMLTLLSDQLAYIFNSMEPAELRNIDYITQRYIRFVLQKRPLFKDSMETLLSNAKEQSDIIANNQQAINELIKRAKTVLNGTYRYESGEEKIYLENKKYVKINLASSGQQEIVWILNILFYYLLNNQRIFLMLEEPESHLFPEAQRQIGEILGLFHNSQNNLFITTHSPYLLGTFNYLLQAGQCLPEAEAAVKEAVHRRCWLKPNAVEAYFVENGGIRSVVDRADSLVLIENEVIDGASLSINNISDRITEANWAVEDEDGSAL